MVCNVAENIGGVADSVRTGADVLGRAAAAIHACIIGPIIPTCRITIIPRVEVSLVVDSPTYRGAGIAQVEEVVMVDENPPGK